MPTINQLLKKKRIKQKARDKVPALERSPVSLCDGCGSR